MFDCIVVGAGPAGTSAAYHLAAKNRSVLVIDKAAFPRKKTCGGGVSPAIAKLFDFDFAPVIERTVSKVKYTWKMDDPMEIQLKGITPMWMVQRDKFDNFLIERAVEKGVEFKDSLEVTGIELQGDIWQINTNHGDFSAKYLIAADGANSKVAEWLGCAAAQKVPAASLEVPGEVSDRRSDMAFFDFGSVKNGFMWCFPKADGYSFSAAFVRNRQGKPEELKQQLTNYAAKFDLDTSNAEYKEHQLNLWQEDRPLHSDRALIIGEAAGIVDPLIGEGIRPAMFTGVAAAEAIDKALNGEAEALAQYSETIKQEWSSDLSKAQFLANIFYKAPKLAYKLGLKRSSAGQLMGKILCGELTYSEVAAIATKKLRFIPGLG